MIFIIFGLLFGLYVTYYFETRRMYSVPRHFPLKIVAFILCLQFIIIGATIDIIYCHLESGFPFTFSPFCTLLKAKY